MNFKKYKHKKCSSLMETVVATLLLATVFVGVMTTFSVISRENSRVVLKANATFKLVSAISYINSKVSRSNWDGAHTSTGTIVDAFPAGSEAEIPDVSYEVTDMNPNLYRWLKVYTTY